MSWAELTVNFEIVTGKAVPTRNGAKTRTYGQAAVPLLESPDNLYTKVLTMSNACRCLARLLGKPVVVGRQTRVQIAGLPGNHQFNGLDRKPLMSLESQTRQTLHDCLHKRLFAEIDSVSAMISACETPAQNPVNLAALGLNLLKWDVSKNREPVEAPPSAEFFVPAPVKICPSSNPSVELEFFKHDVFKRGNRWLCRLCPCSSGASNGPRFKKVRCLRDLCHDFKFSHSCFTCSKCGENRQQ